MTGPGSPTGRYAPPRETGAYATAANDVSAAVLRWRRLRFILAIRPRFSPFSIEFTKNAGVDDLVRSYLGSPAPPRQTSAHAPASEDSKPSYASLVECLRVRPGNPPGDTGASPDALQFLYEPRFLSGSAIAGRLDPIDDAPPALRTQVKGLNLDFLALVSAQDISPSHFETERSRIAHSFLAAARAQTRAAGSPERRGLFSGILHTFFTTPGARRTSALDEPKRSRDHGATASNAGSAAEDQTSQCTAPTDKLNVVGWAFRLLANATRLNPEDPEITSELADLVAWIGARELAAQLYIRAAESAYAASSFDVAARNYERAGLCWSSISPRKRSPFFGRHARYDPSRCFAAANNLRRQLGDREAASVTYVWARSTESTQDLIEFVSRKFWLFGESPARVLFVSTLFVLGFAGAFWLTGLRDTALAEGESLEKAYLLCEAGRGANVGRPPAGRALYFSTVTFSTLGYGDLQPPACALPRALAALEALLGIVSVAAFLVATQRRYVGW